MLSAMTNGADSIGGRDETAPLRRLTADYGLAHRPRQAAGKIRQAALMIFRAALDPSGTVLIAGGQCALALPAGG